MKRLYFLIILVFTNYNFFSQEVLKINLAENDTIFVYIDNHQMEKTDYKILAYKKDSNHVTIDCFEKKIVYKVKSGLIKKDSLQAVNFVKDFNSGMDKDKLQIKYNKYLDKQIIKVEFQYIKIKSTQTENLDVISLKASDKINIRDLPFNSIEIKGKLISKKFNFFSLIDLSFIEFYTKIPFY
jgi:hypothetical protein